MSTLYEKCTLKLAEEIKKDVDYALKEEKWEKEEVVLYAFQEFRFFKWPKGSTTLAFVIENTLLNWIKTESLKKEIHLYVDALRRGISFAKSDELREFKLTLNLNRTTTPEFSFLKEAKKTLRGEIEWIAPGERLSFEQITQVRFFKKLTEKDLDLLGEDVEWVSGDFLESIFGNDDVKPVAICTIGISNLSPEYREIVQKFRRSKVEQ